MKNLVDEFMKCEPRWQRELELKVYLRQMLEGGEKMKEVIIEQIKKTIEEDGK